MSPKLAKKFVCERCNYKCSKKSDMDKHFLTAKHKNRTNRTETRQKLAKANLINIDIFKCECGKEYKARNSLWYHKQKCDYSIDDINNITDITDNASNIDISNPNIVVELLRQNQEFKELIIETNKQMKKNDENNTQLQNRLVEICKEGKNINSGNTINNNNNQRFNINFFLNDTCKDAMSITEFLQNMVINLSEIEYIGNHGYVSGMTKMIMDRLKSMDITKRPIHCTDIKRETMYIKEDNGWSKDTDELQKLRRILSRISMTNYRTVPDWKTENPESEVMETRAYDFCYKMMSAILGDVEDEQVKLDNKVIKTLAKELYISK